MEPILVGNDVVDLTHPRCHGKARDSRFVGRVFSPVEAELIRGADAPDRTLWLLWAAKEAGFKVVSKVLGSPPPFAHVLFQVEVPSAARPRVVGRVSYGDLHVPLVAQIRPDWIHALAWSGGMGGTSPSGLPPSVVMAVDTVEGVLEGPMSDDLDDLLRVQFTDRERASVHGLPSAAVRIGARRHVARSLAVDVGVVEIVCEGGSTGRTPPRLVVQGRADDLDVSLSHDGALVAWAAALSSVGQAGS
jgi:phosphopantetheinyl transferase (holo-ACP synthase)